jgi:DNA repair exonuclease SbcCD ATPase subunit
MESEWIKGYEKGYKAGSLTGHAKGYLQCSNEVHEQIEEIKKKVKELNESISIYKEFQEKTKELELKTEKNKINQQIQFVEWLKENGIYNPMESGECMNKMFQVWKVLIS